MGKKGKGRIPSAKRQMRGRIPTQVPKPIPHVGQKRDILEDLQHEQLRIVQLINMTANSLERKDPPARLPNLESKRIHWSKWGKRATTSGLKVLLPLLAGALLALHSKEAQAILKNLGLHRETIAIPSTGFPEYPWEINAGSPVASPRQWELNNGWYLVPSLGATNQADVQIRLQNSPEGRPRPR